MAAHPAALRISSRHSPIGGRRLFERCGAPHPSRGRGARAGARRDPPAAAGLPDLVQGCAASQSWSSACASAWKRRPGGRIGPALARRVAPTAGRRPPCYGRGAGCRSCALRRFGAASACRQQFISSATGDRAQALLAVKAGAPSQLSRVSRSMTPQCFWQHACSSNPRRDFRPGQSLREVEGQERRPSNEVRGRTSVL